MPLVAKEERIKQFFRISVALKGVHAVLETAGGFLLLFLNPATITAFIVQLTQDELSEDPNDLVSNSLLRAAHQFSLSGPLFSALYLLSHGIIKIILVTALFKNKLWAYPWSLSVLGIFIVYQLYRYSHTRSLSLIALSVFDIVVMWSIWREYQIVRAHPQQLA